MAMQFLTNANAGTNSRWLDVRSSGRKLVPMRVVIADNTAIVGVWWSPTSTGVGAQLFGTVAIGGGSVVIDEPVDYIQVRTDPAEAGGVDAYLETSR